MPLVTPLVWGHGGSTQSNLTASSRAGTTVTAGATAHTKGAWVSLIDPLNDNAFGLWIRVKSIATSATVTAFLIDFGYGPTGGGSEQVLLPNLNCAAVGVAATNSAAKNAFVPIYLPSGTRLSMRAQAAIASDTAVVAVWICQDPLYAQSAGPITDYGTTLASSRGTSVTGGAGAFGSWTQLTASTSRNHRYWAVGVGQAGDTTLNDTDHLIELGVGPDSANVTTIYQGAFETDNGEDISSVMPFLSYAPVKSATALWARIAASATTEIFDVIAYGMD